MTWCVTRLSFPLPECVLLFPLSKEEWGLRGDGFCFVRCIPARCAPTPFLRKEGGMDILPRLQRPRYALRAFAPPFVPKG